MATSTACWSTVELSVAATPRKVASSALRRLASSNARALCMATAAWVPIASARRISSGVKRRG